MLKNKEKKPETKKPGKTSSRAFGKFATKAKRSRSRGNKKSGATKRQRGSRGPSGGK